jgi:hypothetical protein
MRNLIYLLIFLFPCLNLANDIIAITTQFDQTKKREFYNAFFIVGTPPVELKLSIDVSTDQIIVFNQLNRESISWSNADSTDLVIIAAETYRLAITLDPTESLPESANACTGCAGVFGMALSSFMWQIWPYISFTTATITLGKLNGIFETHSSMCPFMIIDCDPSDLFSLCKTTAQVINFDTPLQITTQSDTILPDTIYSAYLNEKNVYSDNINSWDPLFIEFFASHTFNPNSLLPTNVDYATCLQTFNMELTGPDLVVKDGNSLTVLLEPSATLPVQLGLSAFRKAIFFRDSINNVAYIKFQKVTPHYSTWNLILFFLAFAFLLRWKVVDSTEIKNSKDERIYNIADVVFQIISIPLYVVGISLSSTRNVLLVDFPLIYWTLLIVIILLFLVDMITVLTTIHIYVFATKRVKLNPQEGFRLMLLKNVAHESLLTIAMFLYLLERRLEGISNISNFFILTFMIYNLTYYLILIGFHTYNQTRKIESLPPSYLIGTHFLFILMYLYFSIIWIANYISPLCAYYFTRIQGDLTVLITIFLYVIIFDIVAYMTRFYMMDVIRKFKVKET